MEYKLRLLAKRLKEIHLDKPSDTIAKAVAYGQEEVIQKIGDMLEEILNMDSKEAIAEIGIENL